MGIQRASRPFEAHPEAAPVPAPEQCPRWPVLQDRPQHVSQTLLAKLEAFYGNRVLLNLSSFILDVVGSQDFGLLGRVEGFFVPLHSKTYIYSLTIDLALRSAGRSIS